RHPVQPVFIHPASDGGQLQQRVCTGSMQVMFRVTLELPAYHAKEVARDSRAFTNAIERHAAALLPVTV
ncbi:hypothetical protein ACFQVI_004705, partial [Salmonella enterica]